MKLKLSISGLIKQKNVVTIDEQDYQLTKKRENRKQKRILNFADSEIIYTLGIKFSTYEFDVNGIIYNVKNGLKATTITNGETEFVIKKVDKKYRIFVNEAEIATYEIFKPGKLYEMDLITEIYKDDLLNILIINQWSYELAASTLAATT